MLSLDHTGVYVICYGMYAAVVLVVQAQRSLQLFNTAGKPAAQPGMLLWLHIGGIFLLGLLPFAVAKPLINQLAEQGDAGYFTWASVVAALLLAIFLGATDGRKFTLAVASSHPYTKPFYRRYFLLRIPFLISYELFFRGLLLFANKENMGLSTALLVDILLTVLLHIFSGTKWMLGCIPFSVAACMLNLQTHSVWPSILLHLALSLSFEMSVIHKFSHPTNSAL